jgi:hypothetical protein
MMLQVLHCPPCQGTDIVRHGQTRPGKQRYRGREQRCAGRPRVIQLVLSQSCFFGSLAVCKSLNF